ncbi:NAD(P)-dependent oxidoreductase [Caballeronia sp. LP006]|uniref:NAD(P)-dependent oxidoreductase n=1 Tax=Caballeronia sp. LP006 TaxID=3038552 RepID=UPI00285FACCE|nr:NAD(P)-dependent oxidoreductase [Caballeronia sp. LP006]MDR5828936.1 NAD(P)-dependent oxidoreductase [Caballeronia sp. LP006]
MTMKIAGHRLTQEQLACEFSDVAPLLDATAAAAAASRCHYCYDAPCVQACPTQIDIPSFIRKISHGNLKGAAVDILSANPLGGMCSRVCPTEILCEGSCVRNHPGDEPVRIGALQRHATDSAMARAEPLFKRAPETGRRIAIVGAGPAGLACAYRLALAGHQAIIFDARAKPGGLNEYGIAAYKTVEDFAQREIEWLHSIGGIEIKTGVTLGRDVTLDELRKQYDAVFIGFGLAGVRELALEGESLEGVMNAVDFIEQVRQADDLASVPVGRRVVVIGGGNTAVDAAVQSRKLGATSVTMAYRRGVENMGATWAEQEFAQNNNVTIVTHANPVRLIGADGHVTGVEFDRAGERLIIEADMVLKAIGQTLVPVGIDRELLSLDGGRIVTDENRQTTLAKVWAGGDCATHEGLDLTVQAVQDGKLAAASIGAFFELTAIKAA